MKKIIHIFVFANIVLICCMMASCSNRPKGVLSPGKMEDILVDYHLLKTMVNNLPPQERYKAILYENAFYNQHHITKAQLDSSLVWYTSHTNDFAKVYDKVTKRLKKEQDNYANAVSQTPSIGDMAGNQFNANGDTASIMKMPNYYCLSNSPASTNVSFSIFPNNLNPRDVIMLSVRCSMMSFSVQGTLMLSVTYVNDSTITDYRSINSEGIYTVRVQNNNPIAIKNIRAFIYCGTGVINSTRTFMIVDKMSFVRIHVHTPAPVNRPPGMPGRPMPATMPMDTNKAHMVKMQQINNGVHNAVISPVNVNNKSHQTNAASQAAANASQALQNEPMDASHPRPISTNRDEIMKKLSERAKNVKK